MLKLKIFLLSAFHLSEGMSIIFLKDSCLLEDKSIISFKWFLFIKRQKY